MQKTKLINLLRQLDSKKHRRFAEFVHSPIFNKNRKVTALCDYLLTYAPIYRPEDIEKEVVFTIVFGKKGQL